LVTVLNTFDANEYAASVRVHALKPHAVRDTSRNQETAMKTIQVYDKPMCCSTGICGPAVDPVLPRFAADLDWLKSQGHPVERYNLAQQPQAFIQNADVHQLLATQGTDCLPLIVVDGHLVSRRGYPSREMLSLWAGTAASTSASNCCGGPAKDVGSACGAVDEQLKVTTGSGCGCETGCC
jgi:arsenite methyltransferase